MAKPIPATAPGEDPIAELRQSMNIVMNLTIGQTLDFLAPCTEDGAVKAREYLTGFADAVDLTQFLPAEKVEKLRSMNTAQLCALLNQVL